MTPQKAVFVDIDNTIIRGTSINILVKFAYKKGLIPLSLIPKVFYWYFLYKMNYIKDFSHIVRRAALILKTVLEANSAEAIRAVFGECFQVAIKPRIYPDSDSWLREFDRKGFAVYFVSSTLEPLATELRNYFNFGEVIATELVEEEGHFLAQVKGKICYGQEKLEKIIELTQHTDIHLEESYAYSDHISDIPMLEKVGHPVVINPSRKLRKLAEKRGWDVRRITRGRVA